MGEEFEKHIFYAEDGTPIDTTTKNIEIATNDFLAKRRKYLAKANAILEVVSMLSHFKIGKTFTKNRAKLLFSLANKKRTKYFRYMCYLEKSRRK